VHYISRQQAYRIGLKLYPNMVAHAPGNPFPDSYEVIPKSGDQVEAIARQLKPVPSGVQRICPPPPGTQGAKTTTGKKCGGIAHRVITVANYLWLVVLIAFVVLLVSSTLLVANTIRLSIFARRREIEVMKLVGATNWFVRGPFMIEGLLCGLGGAVVAIILLILGRTVFLGPLINIHEAGVHAWPFGLHVLIILGAGLLLGAAGSGLTIRRFLQV
jgi:cell division transport system permease protein